MENRIGQAFEYVEEYTDHLIKYIYLITGVDVVTGECYEGKKINATGMRSKISDWSSTIDEFEDMILRGIVYPLYESYPEHVRVKLYTGEIRRVPRGSLVVYKKDKASPMWIETFLDTEKGRKEAEKMAKRRKAEILTIQ